MCPSGYMSSALRVLVYLRSAQGPSVSHKCMWPPPPAVGSVEFRM